MNTTETDTDSRCSHCASARSSKPIAHRDVLDEPVGRLCFGCYSQWVTVSRFSEGCLVCGQDGEYVTTRELPTLSDGPIMAEGALEICAEHIRVWGPPGERLRGQRISPMLFDTIVGNDPFVPRPKALPFGHLLVLR